MASNQHQVIRTLADVFSMMAPYAGGSIPASTDPQYADWKRWVQLGQQDAANRGFWGRLLIDAELSVVANERTAELPDNFHKRNGIYVLNVNGVDWNAPNNSASQRLHTYMDPETGKWMVRFAELPTESATAELWYFYNPPILTDEEDPLILDGEMVGFYALKEYFRKTRQFGSLDDARLEYENRREELLSLEVLPTPQEIMSWSSFYSHKNLHTNERIFYAGRRDRRRGRY